MATRKTTNNPTGEHFASVRKLMYPDSPSRTGAAYVDRYGAPDRSTSSIAWPNQPQPPQYVMPRVDYVSSGYPEEQVGGIIPYGGQSGGFTRPRSGPYMGPSEQLISPYTWQGFLDMLKGGRARGSQAKTSGVQSIIPGAGGTPELPSIYTPDDYVLPQLTGYPEEDIGAGAGLYPAYEPVPPATPEAIEEEKEVVDTAVGDDLKTQEKSELHDIIDRAYKGEFGAVDDQAIEGMLESLRKRLFALYESPDSFTGDPPLMKPSVLAKTATLQNSIDSLEGFRDRMSDINAAYQTEAQRMASVELATELGRGLFPNLFPEGGQISFNDLNLLLQLAEFRRKEAVLAKAPDVTKFRGFEGGRTPTRGMMA